VPLEDPKISGPRIAAEAMRRVTPRDRVTPADARDTLTKWHRESGLVPNSVRFDLPLRDTAEIKRHMILVKQVVDRVIATCDAAMAGSIPEQSAQFAIRQDWRALTLQVNKYKTRRPD
jgi:hypothetical protein